MGNSRWDPTDWQQYSQQTSAKTQSQIFTQRTVANDLDPKGFKIRESVDSASNPESTPIILAVDETGSMGYLSEEIIKRGLGTIMAEIYDRKPVHDPHIMCMGIGDGYVDRHPLQMTQFEAGVKELTPQVEKIFLEGNGGGNGGESYNLAWYGAAFRTKCDAFIKRQRKGYLFTIGDEPPHKDLTKDMVKRITGDSIERDLTSKDLLNILTPNWEVFHLMVGADGYGNARTKWKELLGERVIQVSDHTKLAEVIVSTIQMTEGADLDAVVDSWSGDTSIVVRDAVKALQASKKGADGLVAL